MTLHDLIPDVSVPAGSAGLWTIEKFEVNERASAFSQITDRSRYIRPGTYTRLIHMTRGVIMSDTPAEKKDHVDFVMRARGDVLINGLGLGMCLAAVLRKPEVNRVFVVELDRDVVSLVAPHYDDPRVEIINCDALEYKPAPNSRFGAVWHDIWDSICPDNLPEMHKLHRKYGRLTDWQGSWCRWECERRAA